MTILASDPFTGGANADLGTSWDPCTGESGPNGFQLSGSGTAISSTGGGQDCSETNNSVTWPNDQYAEVTFAVTGNGGVGTGMGPICRAATGNVVTRYRCIGSASGYELLRFNTGNATLLSSGSGTVFGAGDKLRLQVKTSGANCAWTLFRNGVSFATGSDTSPIASGRAGIAFSSTDGTTELDAFEGGDVGTSGAALAGGSTAAAAGTGALSTGIRLAGAPATVSTAVGFLMGLMGAAAPTVTSSGALTTAIQAAAAAIATTTSTATMGGGIQISGGASSSTSAAAVLTNWTTVTLTAPLFTGAGGLLDPHLWLDSTPQVGTVVYYDATHLTIASDGQLSGDIPDFTAVVMFQDSGGNWALAIIRFTSGLAAFADISTLATSSLQTGIRLLAAAALLTQAAAAMNTVIRLQGAVQAVTNASATLVNAIILAGTATDDTSASGTLSGTVQSFAANAAASVTATGFLNSQIQMASAAAALVSATGALATHIVLATTVLSSTSGQGTLVTGTPMTAAAQAAAAATGALLTAIRVVAPTLAVIQSSADLTTHINLLSSVVSQTAVTGSLATFTGLQANAQAVSSALGALSALVTLRSDAFSITQAQANLLTAIPLQGGVLVTDSVQGLVTATGASVGLYPIDPAFVIGVRRQYYTEQFPEVPPNSPKLLTFNFQDSLPPGVLLQGLISVNVVNSAGQDMNPSAIIAGPAAYDHTLTEVTFPIDPTNQDDGNDYYFTVTAPTTNPFLSITRFGLLSVRS